MIIIIIRRLVGALLFIAGVYILRDEIGWIGTAGVTLVMLGLLAVAGNTPFFLSVSQEYKTKREKDDNHH